MATVASAWHVERHARISREHPEVRDLMGADPWSGVAIVCLVLVQMAVAVWMRSTSWAVLVLAAWAFGAFLSHGLGVLIHEATHNLVARGSAWNKLWGIVANVPLVAPVVVAFRREHLLHHRHLGDADGLDTQAPTRTEARVVGASTVLKALSFTFGRFFFYREPREGKTPRDGWLVLNVAVQLVAMGTLVALAGPRPLVYLVVAALAAYGPHPLGARRLSEHLPMLARQPTVSYYGPLDWLSFHVGHHVEHHDFAAVPWRRLPRLRALAREHYDGLFQVRSWTLLLVEYFARPAYRVDHYVGMGASLQDESRGRLVSWHGSDATWSVWTWRAAWLLAGMTALRLAIIATAGLSDTEAYYTAWARFPDWSYYDHPPLLAWMTWVAMRVSASAFALRLGPVLCALAFGALLYRLASRLFSPRAGFFAVVIVSAVPAFFFTSFLVNPESPLAPLWVLALLCIEGLGRGTERWRPLALGAVVGVGFLAKYSALLLVPVALLYVATSPDTRHWLRRPSFYLAGLVALVFAAPVIFWNVAHDWPSVHLHLVERVAPLAGAPTTLGHDVLRIAESQLAMFHPLIFPGLVAALVLAVRRAPRDARYRLLATAGVPVSLFFLAVMAKVRDPEPHWTMVGYVAAIVAAAGWLDERAHRASRVLASYVSASLLLSVAAVGLYAVHTQTPALMKLVPEASYPADLDPVNETLGWDGVRDAIRAQAAQLGPGAVVVGAHNVLCGHVQVATNDAPAVYCRSPRRTEFDFLGRRELPPGAPVVLVDSRRYPADVAEVLPGMRCEVKQRVGIERGGRVLNEYRVRACVPGDDGTLRATVPVEAPRRAGVHPA